MYTTLHYTALPHHGSAIMLSLSLSHIHTHIHTHTLSLSLSPALSLSSEHRSAPSHRKKMQIQAPHNTILHHSNSHRDNTSSGGEPTTTTTTTTQHSSDKPQGNKVNTQLQHITTTDIIYHSQDDSDCVVQCVLIWC